MKLTWKHNKDFPITLINYHPKRKNLLNSTGNKANVPSINLLFKSVQQTELQLFFKNLSSCLTVDFEEIYIRMKILWICKFQWEEKKLVLSCPIWLSKKERTEWKCKLNVFLDSYPLSIQRFLTVSRHWLVWCLDKYSLINWHVKCERGKEEKRREEKNALSFLSSQSKREEIFKLSVVVVVVLHHLGERVLNLE